MIAIINTGEGKGDTRKYRLQINHTLISTFEHERSDGLAVCLRKAAEAAEADEKEGDRL